MPEQHWEYVAVAGKRNGKPNFPPLNREQQKLIPAFDDALNVAAQSEVSHPIYSGYRVKESISGLPAGNISYGKKRALHGEEVAVANIYSKEGIVSASELPLILRNIATYNPAIALPKIIPNLILAIIAHDPDGMAKPCGNCLDLLRDKLGRSLNVVFGASGGGEAKVAKLGDFLFEVGREHRISLRAREGPNLIATLAGQTFSEGTRLTDDAYVSKAEALSRNYNALVVTNKGKYYGGYECLCDYHPIYAGRDAIRQARRAHDYFLRYALFTAPGPGNNPPDIMYMDRQHLMEYALIGDLETGREGDKPVYLASIDPQRKAVTGLWQTSVREFLPFPFSPINFGEEFVSHFKEYYRRRKRF